MNAATPAPAGHRIWSGIICPEPPPCRNRHDELIVQAKAMLATRERNFPMMVQRREMTGEEAEAQLRTFRMLVGDIEWIISTKSGEQPGDIPITEADRRAICAALDNSVETLGQIAAEAGHPMSIQLSEQAHDVIAMRWNYAPERGPLGGHSEQHGCAIFNGGINRELRISQKRKATK